MFLRQREDRVARRGVQQVESDHDHVEVVFREDALQHRVARVSAEALGDAEEADLSHLPVALELRQQHLDAVLDL